MKFIQFALAVACVSTFSVSAGPVVVMPVRVTSPSHISTATAKPGIANGTSNTVVKTASPSTTTNTITPVNSPIHLSNSLAAITASQKCSNEKNKKENGC